MDDEHQRWLEATKGKARERWLVAAHEGWQEMLKRAKRSKKIELDKLAFQLVAVDATVLESLQRLFDLEPSVSKVKVGSSQLWKSVESPTMDIVAWEPEFPVEICRISADHIGRMLVACPSLSILNCLQTPLPVVTTIIASCRHVESLSTRMLQQEHQTADQINDFICSILGHELSLVNLSMINIGRQLFRALCPALLNVPNLLRLALCGCTRSPDPLNLSTSADVAMFCSTLQIPSLEELTLDHFRFTSDAAAEAFSQTILSSSLKRLDLGTHIQFPGSQQLDLVNALANSRLAWLKLFMPIEPEALATFAPALAKSTQFMMKDLDIQIFAPDRVFIYYHDHPLPQTHGLDEEWIRQVKRAMDMNRQFETSVPVFETFQRQAQQHYQTVRFANVFAVHPVILFDYLRHDRFSMLKVLQEVAGTLRGGMAGPKAAKRQKQSCPWTCVTFSSCSE